MKKFLLLLLFILTLPFTAYSDDQTDYLTRVQTQISADISKLKVSLETQLKSISLTSTDIDNRLQQITAMTASASDDMASWGYTPDQREYYTGVLSELSIAYSAYKALLNAVPQVPDSDDMPSFSNIESPDINDTYALRQEIAKLSRGLDVQTFYLQSKINRLRLELNEAAALQKQEKDAQEGGTPLKLPRTHALELENARVNAALSSLQVRTNRKAFEKNLAEIRRDRKLLADMVNNLRFPQSVLDSNLKSIQTRLSELGDEMKTARKALDTANAALSRARAAAKPGDPESASRITARTARVNYWEYMISLLTDEVELTRDSQEVWRNRYKLFHDDADGEEIWRIREQTSLKIQELQRELEGIRNLTSTIIREINDTNAQAQQEGISATVKQNLLQAVDYKRKMIYDVANRYESFIPKEIFLLQRLLSEAGDKLTALRLAEKVSAFSKETIMGFLNTELWQGDGYSITVSKLTVAILVFLSSFFLSSMGSNWIKRRIMKRAKASITAANAIQRIVFYILWVVFLLIALNIVNIPLTAFAFMGGTITVAIAFGMQNIFNNLISGFIIIFSRPFKVNDIVDVAGIQGVVSDIGSRSTTVKTWDGLDVILPNRYFLENNVTNWTGSDIRKRGLLTVGVSYDADSRTVEKLLLDIAGGHSQILKNPAPFVIFRDFGDNALIFDLYYWIELRKSAEIKVSSDLRHHIAAVFNREGIEIPFPQRVVHMAPSDNNEEKKDDNTEKPQDTEKQDMVK